MENYAREVILIGNQYQAYENIFDVSLECVLTPNDITSNMEVEDVLLHANILAHESNVSCPNQPAFFAPISTFDNDFESFFDSPVHNFMNIHNVENEIKQEVVVEEVAELEISISDSLIGESPCDGNTHEDREKPSPSPLRTDGRQQCDICYKKFSKKSSLSRHLLFYHSEILTYECFECGRLFAEKNILINHLKRHKKGQKPEFLRSRRDKSISRLKCDEKRMTNDSGALTNHRASHNSISSRSGSSSTRIFPCHACDKTFSSKSSQQIHTRIHTGERPYKCHFCVKAFADGGTLRKHERIHTGEKPYMCPICKKAFNQRVVLREHIRVHHVKIYYKHYTCEVCSTTFDTSQELCYHLVKHSDENTAKHRALLTKPRKYKKSSCTGKNVSQNVRFN